MSLALRNPRVLALVVFVALTVLVLAVVLFSAVGHINVFHMVGSLLHPDAYYNHGSVLSPDAYYNHG